MKKEMGSMPVVVPFSLKLSVTFGLIEPNMFVRNEIEEYKEDKKDEVVIVLHVIKLRVKSFFVYSYDAKSSNIF